MRLVRFKSRNSKNRLPMQISTQENLIQPYESTILLIKQMARMYKTVKQQNNTCVVVGLN